MALFGSKRSPQTPAAISSLTREQKAELVITSNRVVFTKQFESVEELFGEALKLTGGTYDSLERDEHSKVMHRVRSIQDVWMSIDRLSLTERDAVIMFNILIVKLPQIASVFTQAAIKTGIWDVNRPTEAALKYINLPREFSDLITVLNTIRSEQSLRQFVLSQQRQEEGVVAFPEYYSQHRPLSQAYTSLKQKWEAAWAVAQTTEDKFFLEQVASRYLPDAWRMYEGFLSSPHSVVEKATGILLEQITLMGSKLDEILLKNEEASLEEFAIHTDFLKTVVEGKAQK